MSSITPTPALWVHNGREALEGLRTGFCNYQYIGVDSPQCWAPSTEATAPDHMVPLFSEGELACAVELARKEANRQRDELLAASVTELLEPSAHIFPSDLERFSSNETFAHAYSIPVGSPVEDSVPLYSEGTVYSLQDRIGSLLHLLGRCEIFIKAVDAENGRHILNDIQEARGES